MIAGKPAPPNDERSKAADLIERMQVDSDRTLEREYRARLRAAQTQADTIRGPH
jgi:hypothetical protein